MRLFITHGGLFSITEAIYHEVPILGFPVFADQESNMLYAVHDGIGESIEWDDLTEEFLKQKLSNLLQDKKYGTCSENNIKNDCRSLKTCASETEIFLVYVFKTTNVQIL